MEMGPEGRHVSPEETLSSEPKSGKESEAESTSETGRETERTDADMYQAAEEAARDIVDELNPEDGIESLRNPENRRTLSNKISDSIKKFWQSGGIGAVAGFAGVSAARIAIKQSALLYLGGSMGAGAIAGAVAGAAIEGGKTYMRERRKFVAHDIIEQLNSAQNPKEKAAIVAKAEIALKEARISNPDEISGLVDVVREARLKLETESHKDELRGQSEAQQISWLLKASGRNLKEIPRSEKKQAKALLKKIEFTREKSKVDYAKVGKAVVKGALVGALGGAVGGALSHYVFENLHPGEWMEKAVEPIQQAHPGISQEQAQALAEQALREKAEVAAAAAVRVIAEGKQNLLEETFSAEAEPGNGWTHLARNAVHDYLANVRELSPDAVPELNTEQLVHIEDTLVKEQLRSGSVEVIHVGQKLELTGAKIQSLIDKAQGLSPEKIENISRVLEEPAHYLSPATREWLADYEQMANPDNSFARDITERAREAATLAAAAVQEVAVPEAIERSAARAAQPAAAETLAPQAPDTTSRHVKVVLGVLGAGALAGYAAKRAFGKKPGEAKEVKQAKKTPAQPASTPQAGFVPAPAAVRPTAPIAEAKIPADDGRSSAESAAAVAAVGAVALAAKAGGEALRPEPLGVEEQVSGEDETSVNQNNMEQFEAGKPHEALTGKPEDEDEKEEEEEAPEPKKEPVPPIQEAVPFTAEQEKDIERKNRVRAAVWYTIEKLKGYSELLTSEDGRKLTTEKELQERFIELVKKYWKEFTTHGTYNAREIDPATGKATVEKYMDLDAGACVFLLKQAGIEVDTDAIKINYVPQGHTADTGVVIDTSDEFGVTTDKEGKKLTIDHHTSEPLRDASSTRFLYELLSNSDMGLLEKDPWLEKFVAYVTKEDNKNYTDEEARDVWENYGRNFVSLAKENMTFEEMKKFFEDGKYTPYERLPDAYLKKLSLVFNAGRGELRKQTLDFAVRRLEGYKKEALERIQWMEQQGFVLDSGDSRFGRILIDTGWETDEGDWLKKNRFEIDAARAQGYGGNLAWLPEKNQFFLKTVKQMDFDIPGAYNVRSHYIMHGDVTEEMETSLQEILAKLTGNPDYEIQGELKNALESEMQTRNSIAEKAAEFSGLLADKKLTKDMVEESAKQFTDVNFSASGLLYRVLKTNPAAFAIYEKIPSRTRNTQRAQSIFAALETFNSQPDTAAGISKAAPKTPAKRVPAAPPAAPKAVPARAVSAPAAAPDTQPAPEAHPAAVPGQTPEKFQAFEGFETALRERYPGAADKLTQGEHWDELGSEAKKYISATLLRLLDMDHEIEKKLAQYDKLSFNITGITPDQLRNQSEYIGIDTIQPNAAGSLEISLEFASISARNKMSRISRDAVLSGEMLMWDKALIEPSEREYSRDWTRGRAQELESRFPEFSSKLSDVQNWGALDEEAKDNLADAFLAFFNTYPEYADAAKNDNREYAIELADAITQDMRTGKMILLEDVLVDSDTHAVELRMGSRNKEHWNREYTPSLYGDRGDRFDYLMDISRTLAALWK